MSETAHSWAFKSKLPDSDGNARIDAEAELPVSGIIGLYGESGAGKTTLLRILAGLESNANLTDIPFKRAGMVFQQAGLFPHLSVKQNLQLAASYAPHEVMDIGELSQKLGFSHLIERDCNGLSGGEQQRIAIARAIINAPDLLLLDEAVSALDQTSRINILNVLVELSQTLSLPMIMVSHQLAELSQYCDYLMHMQAGKIVAHGHIQQMVQQLNISRSSGAFSHLQCQFKLQHSQYGMDEYDVEGQALFTASQNKPLNIINVAASRVSISTSQPAQGSMLNCLTATLSAIENVDQYKRRLVLQIGQQQLLADISVYSLEILQLQIGMPLWAQFKLHNPSQFID
ncbi:ATP-binding cassette domain-containing protein [Neptunicella marina]|uniref:ATP-binding cassette domain-containing protein n=1 Tax=Neptunicella marina TaxID=2125989 RepID=A0A8J6IW86_9ALTE|nr:ATP-binding cassette domain-containing protein [Neptunicella marina]MBC3767399.1 ATP-binding cassette domain-containing protein [Neptunicella marina]